MILKKWSRDLFTGILTALPLIITIAVITWLFRQVNEGLISLFNLCRIDITGSAANIFWKIFTFFTILLIFTLIGILTRNFLGKKLLRIIEWYVKKVPVANRIYNAIKEVRDAFIGSKKTNYKRVVMVEYPQKENWVVGFVTSEATDNMKNGSAPDAIGVFIPTAPNPTSGVLVYFSEKKVYPLNMSVKDAFKLIISGGAVKPSNIKKENNEKNIK